MLKKLVLMLLAAASVASAQTQTAPHPTISAPVTGPGAMFPGLQRVPAGTGLADQKYVVTEYFVSGTASGKPYTTRILVRRPEDAARFSGVVVAEADARQRQQLDVLLLADLHDAPRPRVRGDRTAEGGDRGDDRGLESAALCVHQHPGRRAGQRDHRPGGGSPEEQRADVATGRSEGASNDLDGHVTVGGHAAHYLPAHATWRMPGGGPIFDGFLPTSTAGMPIPSVDVPLIQIATQTEVNGGAAKGSAYRRPDGDAPGDQFRLYEIAGMPHNDSRENPTYSPDPCKMTVTRYPVGAMMAMALHHVIEWADKGTVPPRADRIVVENGALALDANGNARGGVRSTYVDVPVAKYGVPNNADPKPGTRDDFYCGIAGYETSLPADQLRALHTNAATYRGKVQQRLAELTKAGWFLPEYAGPGDRRRRECPHSVGERGPRGGSSNEGS